MPRHKSASNDVEEPAAGEEGKTENNEAEVKDKGDVSTKMLMGVIHNPNI